MAKIVFFFLVFGFVGFSNLCSESKSQMNEVDFQTTEKKDLELQDFTLLYDAEMINERIRGVAKLLDEEYQEKDLTILMILKGSVFLAADLLRAMETPAALDCIRCSSYGKNGTESGELYISGVEKLEIENKNILLIDDIADTGKTLLGVVKCLKEKNPASIKTLVLLSKKRTKYLEPDYALFEIPDLFVIGYGLDYKERFRGLSEIYMLESSDKF